MIPFVLAREIIKEWDGTLIKSGQYGHAIFGDRKRFYACAEFTLGPSDGLLISEPPLFRGCYGGADNPLATHIVERKARVHQHYLKRSKACEALLSFRTRLHGFSINDLEARIQDEVFRRRETASRQRRQRLGELQDEDLESDESDGGVEDNSLPVATCECIIREWSLVSVTDDDPYEHNSVLPSGSFVLAKNEAIVIPLAIERLD